MSQPIIILEGMTAVGKSTIVKQLHLHIPNLVSFHFPSNSNAKPTTMEEFFTDMSNHWDKIINNPYPVVLDRWWPSTLIHQGSGDLQLMAKMFYTFCPPAYYFLLDLPKNEYLQRIQKNPCNVNKFIDATNAVPEHYESLVFKNREKYLKIANILNWPILDATQSPETITATIVQTLFFN